MHRRSRSRSPMRSNQCHDSRRRNDTEYGACRVLCIRPVPQLWHPDKIKRIIRDASKSKTIEDNIKFAYTYAEDDGTYVALIKFSNSYFCNIALAELKHMEIERKRVSVTLDLDNKFNKLRNQGKLNQKVLKAMAQSSPKHNQEPQNYSKMRENETHQQMNSDQNNDIRQENHETYGLSLQYLDSLHVKLPLSNKIFINNLDSLVTEAKLREVFGFCGLIVSCNLIMSRDGKKIMGKIEYDHPVEAVQAIAMLNNQELYSKHMIVQMDNTPSSLPNGLSSFGPGLGLNGEPLRGIRVHLEARQLKETINKIKTELQRQTGDNPNQSQIAPVITPVIVQPIPNQNMLGVPQVKPMQNLMNPAIQNLLQNTGIQNAEFGMSTENQMSRWDQSNYQWNMMQNSVNQNTGNVGAHYNRQSSDDNRKSYNDNADNRGNNQMQQKSVNSYEPETVKPPSTLVAFSSLPPSVNLQALNNKMREVGEVKFVDILGNGRAIVSFFNVRDAERCVKFFDGSKVDGQMIEVKYF